jgi:hypothetical protein
LLATYVFDTMEKEIGHDYTLAWDMPEVAITNSKFTRAKAKMFGAALTVEARVDNIIFNNVTLSDS